MSCEIDFENLKYIESNKYYQVVKIEFFNFSKSKLKENLKLNYDMIDLKDLRPTERNIKYVYKTWNQIDIEEIEKKWSPIFILTLNDRNILWSPMIITKYILENRLFEIKNNNKNIFSFYTKNNYEKDWLEILK